MSSNIEVKLDVLNQKGSPALFASSLATRPAASFEGRLFVDSDNPSTGLYRDTGSAWIQIADQTGSLSGYIQTQTKWITAANQRDFLYSTKRFIVANDDPANAGIVPLNTLFINFQNDFTVGTVFGGKVGINTNTPSSFLDIHSATGINATFNGTTTTNSALQFQSAGVGKWNVTNKYNSAANDFAITDVLNNTDRLVIKNTGLATYTGFFNVANIASAQNIQISGTTPAYTIVEGTGNANTASIGVASIANNFIQSSVEGDLCIVSQSTVAKRLLLGVQSANSSAICISASNNVLINSTTDAGYKLSVSGTTNITGLLTGTSATFSAIISVGSGSVGSFYRMNYGPSTDSRTWQITNDAYNYGDFAIQVSDSQTGTTFSNALLITRSSVATFQSSVNIGNSVAASIAAPSTHKVAILIGGVQYYLLASNV